MNPKSFILLLVFLVSVLCVSCAMEEEITDSDEVIDQERVNYLNQSVPVISYSMEIEDRANIMAVAATSPIKITHIASIDPPAVPGHQLDLQATSFAFAGTTLTNTYVIITYNYWKETVVGAIEIININDFSNPILVYSKTFPDREFSDVAVKGNYAYAVGNFIGKGAFLQKFDISDITNPTPLETISFNGYSATSIVIEGNGAYIVVGDNLGLLKIDISDHGNLFRNEVYLLDHATYALRYSGHTYLLGGLANFGLYLAQDGALDFLVPLSGGPATSPARMVVAEEMLYTNAQHSGLSIVDLSGPFPNLINQMPIDGTGNGIGVLGKIALLAQGEQGVLAYDIYNPLAPQYLGFFDFSDDRGSANNLRFRTVGNIILAMLSDGLGGFRILKIENRLTLMAMGAINPDLRYQDTSFMVKSTYLEIPSTLYVTEGVGVAGSIAWLSIDDVNCKYGGSGSSYNFINCSDGSMPGNVARAAYRLEMGVDNPDSDYSVTGIEVTLTERAL